MRRARRHPPVRVIGPAEAEAAAIVICALDQPPYYFGDDVHTTCASCGAAIIHRPHAPASAKKLCVDCADLLITRPPGGAS